MKTPLQQYQEVQRLKTPQNRPHKPAYRRRIYSGWEEDTELPQWIGLIVLIAMVGAAVIGASWILDMAFSRL